MSIPGVPAHSCSSSPALITTVSALQGGGNRQGGGGEKGRGQEEEGRPRGWAGNRDEGLVGWVGWLVSRGSWHMEQEDRAG